MAVVWTLKDLEPHLVKNSTVYRLYNVVPCFLLKALAYCWLNMSTSLQSTNRLLFNN